MTASTLGQRLIVRRADADETTADGRCGQTADVWLGVMPQAKTGLQGSTAVSY